MILVGSDAMALATKMEVGWNLGEAFELCASSEVAGETLLGNPPATKALIDGVRRADFRTVRVPCAWSGYIEDWATFRLRSVWVDRVREVIDHIVKNDIYAILNIHWDGGWLELHPFYSDQRDANTKLKALWAQIANAFRTYDEHILFAGCNEIGQGDPTRENIEVQQSFLQIFVDTVQATGGNNGNRNLIIPAFGANIFHSLQFLTLPTDRVANRIFAEVHYADPADFCRDTGAVWLWGRNFAGQEHISTWGQEDYVDERFGQIREHFVNKSVPIILGEYGVSYRLALPEDDLTKHIIARCYFLNYVTKAAIRNGIVPCYWDNEKIGDKGSALFDRKTNANLCYWRKVSIGAFRGEMRSRRSKHSIWQAPVKRGRKYNVQASSEGIWPLDQSAFSTVVPGM
jgi:endoglucanase